MLTQIQEKYHQVLEVAERLYQAGPDWVTFFREILGVDGAVRKSFPTQASLAEFEQSEQYDQIQKMLVRLREQRVSVDSESEPTRVITVRIPKSMHEYLRSEAHDLRTSMNKLCISKLLQVVGEEMIPNERGAEPAAATPPVRRPTAASELAPAGMPPAVGSSGMAAAAPPPFKSSESHC